MKKIFFTITAFLFGIFILQAKSVNEDDKNILEKIKVHNTSYSSITADFTHIRHMPFLEEDMISHGKFYYDKPEKLSMAYTDPQGDLILINGDKFIMIASGKRNETTTKNARMRAMKTILSACMEGDIQKVEPTAITCTETPQYYTVTAELATGKNNKSNICKVITYYDKKDYSVSILYTEESDGTFNRYELMNKKLNQSIEEDIFISER